MRIATMTRETAETKIVMTLNLDGEGTSDIVTGIGFLDHMLTLFSKHGLFDLTVRAKGDLMVDAHHLVEDMGIVLGDLFLEALGDKAGIRRYGSEFTAMDEALILCAADVSGRPYLSYRCSFPYGKVGEFDTELVEEFFRAFVNHSKVTLHINCLEGKNQHHMAEAVFKGFGRTMREAVSMDERRKGVPSTKGVL